MMPRRPFAALAIALFATISVPAAAHADPHVSGSTVSADRYTVSPGEMVTVTWQESYFDPAEAVEVSVDGRAAQTTMLSFGGSARRGAATSSTADASGSVVAQVTFSASEVGSYAIMGSAASAASAASATGGVTVDVVAAAVSGAAAQPTSSGPVLAATGGRVPLGLGVAGGGMLILGAVLVSARLVTRRRIESADSGD